MYNSLTTRVKNMTIYGWKVHCIFHVAAVCRRPRGTRLASPILPIFLRLCGLSIVCWASQQTKPCIYQCNPSMVETMSAWFVTWVFFYFLLMCLSLLSQQSVKLTQSWKDMQSADGSTLDPVAVNKLWISLIMVITQQCLSNLSWNWWGNRGFPMKLCWHFNTLLMPKYRRNC